MKRYSYAVNAIKKLKEKLDIKQPEGLFSPVVIMKTGDITIKNSELDIEFDIPFDDDTEANESEIILYNLSKTTIQKIKKGNKLTIEAGYKGDTGIVLSGYISRKKTKYDGVDKITTINVIDNNKLKEREIENISFTKGCKASYILKTLVGKVGLPVGIFKIVRDYTYKDEVTIDGGLMDSIRKYAQVCGVSAYICKGKIYVRNLKDGDNTRFVIKEDTGLLSVEEFEEENKVEDYVDKINGLNITMLLQHRITTASIINVASKNYKGKYRVRSGHHSYDGTDFLTELEVIS